MKNQHFSAKICEWMDENMPVRVPSVEKILDQYYGDIDTMGRRGRR